MIFLQLFLVFIQIGIFGFGGGYSMISLIQGQVVTQYHWMTMQEFTDVVAISQMTPVPLASMLLLIVAILLYTMQA